MNVVQHFCVVPLHVAVPHPIWFGVPPEDVLPPSFVGLPSVRPPSVAPPELDVDPPLEVEEPPLEPPDVDPVAPEDDPPPSGAMVASSVDPPHATIAAARPEDEVATNAARMIDRFIGNLGTAWCRSES